MQLFFLWIEEAAAAVNDVALERAYRSRCRRKGHSSHHQKVTAKAGSAHDAEKQNRGLNRKLGKEVQAGELQNAAHRGAGDPN